MQDDQPVVLVVDDEPGIRDFLDYALTDAGYRVALAGDGREALAAVRRERPVAVLTDLMMPSMDGWQLCARLHGDPATAALPLIAMSAVAPQGVAADAFLAKPFEIDALLALLARATATRDSTPTRERRAPTGPARLPAEAVAAG